MKSSDAPGAAFRGTLLIGWILASGAVGSDHPGCGLVAAEPVYVIATTAAESDPWWQVAERAGRVHRHAATIRFDPEGLGDLVDELRDRRARYVLFAVPPTVLDVNFCFELLERATTLDDDPFADFAYGFVTGADPATALRFLEQSSRYLRGKSVPPRILDNLGPNTQLPGNGVLPWMGPRWTGFASKHYRAAIFSHGRDGLAAEHAQRHEGHGLIHFGGHGDPGGITSGLRSEMLGGLDLRGAVVFNGACSTGVTSRHFDTRGVSARLERFGPDELFCLKLLRTGVAAYFAAVHPDHGIPVYQEMEHLLTTGAPCGDVMKYSYDGVVMGNGGKPLKLPRFEDGKPHGVQTPKEVMLYGTAARILFGDPLARPVKRTVPGPFDITVRKSGEGHVARVRLVNPAVKHSLQDTFHSDLSANRQQFNDRIYVRIPLPDGVRGVSDVEVSATRGKDRLAHELRAHAVEFIDGRTFLHVQVDFPTTGYQVSRMRSRKTELHVRFRGAAPAGRD